MDFLRGLSAFLLVPSATRVAFCCSCIFKRLKATLGFAGIRHEARATFSFAHPTLPALYLLHE